MAKISFELRILRLALRLVQLYLTVIFSILFLFPAFIGQRLFRVGANLLNLTDWPRSLKIPNDQRIDIQELHIAGIPCTTFKPKELRNTGKLILYVHGGGFMIGSTKTYRSFLGVLADELSCEILSIDYSLAPEWRYPTAINEIQSVHRHLLTNGHSPKDILFGGDSAGGCLVLALLYRLRDSSYGVPCGAFLDSPVTDLTFVGDSMKKNWTQECLLPIFGPFTSMLYKRTFLKYTDGAKLDDPDVSPLFGSFRDIPPIHISYSDHEVFRDDAKRLIRVARSENADVADYSCDWAPHTPLALGRFYPEGRALFQVVCKFIRTHLVLVN